LVVRQPGCRDREVEVGLNELPGTVEMEVSGPAPIGGSQPLEPIRPPETVVPASEVPPAGEMAAAGGVDRVEFSPEAQAQVEAQAPVAGAEAVQDVQAVSTGEATLPALTVDPAHADWLAARAPTEATAILEGQHRFLVSQGYDEGAVTSQIEAYQSALEELRAGG
jgi:hypothetical protein